MCVMGRISGKRVERRAERLDGGAKVETKKGNTGYVPRKMVEEKLDSVKGELKKMNESCYSLTISSQMTQNELKRVRGESKKENVLIESIREVARARKRDGRGKARGSKEVTKRWRYETCL